MKEMKRKKEMNCSKASACKYHATNLYVENLSTYHGRNYMYPT